VDLGFGIEKRPEERQTLDVIHVEMSEKDIGTLKFATCRSQGTDSATAIENEQSLVGISDFDAGRVAAVLHRVRPGTGN
jgi:hypothetical protein